MTEYESDRTKRVEVTLLLWLRRQMRPQSAEPWAAIDSLGARESYCGGMLLSQAGDPAPPFEDQDFDDTWDAQTVI
jgi:hypothetical protein